MAVPAPVSPVQLSHELESIVYALRQLGERLIAAASALEQCVGRRVLWDATQGAGWDTTRTDDTSPPRLTRRERETLALFTQGMGFDEIARVQGVKISTVREQTKSARAKLEVTTTAQAAAKARRLGLIP